MEGSVSYPALLSSDRRVSPSSPELEKNRRQRGTEARAWRSFFGSLLETGYTKAADTILEFVAKTYGLNDLVWLERRGDSFDTAASHGALRGRKVRLKISPADHRLISAMQNDLPLELGERGRSDAPGRTLSLFPVAVTHDITSAIAVLGAIEHPEVTNSLVRLCHSLAPQLEIIRLRNEVYRKEALATALRSFSRSMRRIDREDLWLSLTQSAAQILDAERASLLVYDEREDKLELKAILGSREDVGQDPEIGGRVSQVVFHRGEPAVIGDITKTGLEPISDERGYKSRSFLSCPINVAGRTVGVMNFTDRVDGAIFDEDSLNLFLSVAPQLGVAIDRALLKDKAGKFEQLSVTDALTGLLNRRYMEARLAEETKRSTRHGFPMSILMLDVDHFKSYNDSFGHPAGDEALKLVGEVIRNTLRSADVAARFGGEEFAILLPQTTGEEAIAIAERIRHNIATAGFAHREVTVSIGITSCSAELCVSADLVSAADRALYEAKRRGRNRVQEFEEIAS